jgi:hypothetical protein
VTRLEALTALREAIEGASREELPALLGEIELVKARAVERAQAPVVALPARAEPAGGSARDRVLTPMEVGERLGRSREWTSRHRFELPTVRLPGGRWGVPERSLERWLSRRKTL